MSGTYPDIDVTDDYEMLPPDYQAFLDSETGEDDEHNSENTDGA